MTITLRLVKGSPLTHAELDGNFTDLNGRVTSLESAPPAHTHVLTDITDAGALAALDTIGTAQIDADAVGPDQLANTSVTPGSYTLASITVDAQGRITSASSGSGDLTLVIESATALTVGTDTDGEFNLLTGATAIALTLDAQATVGMRSAFQPAGAGAVTVAVEAGAGYWLPGDNIGGTIRTTSFTLVGYGYLECIRNTDTNSAEWIFVGNSNHAQSLSAALDAADNVISAPELKDVAETVVAVGTLATGAISYDYTAGGWQWGTTGGGNITSVSITNPPATGKLGCITLEIVQGATPRTIAWGAAFRFPGGTDFALTASASAVDIFTFITRDGGTTWYGFEGGKALAA